MGQFAGGSGDSPGPGERKSMRIGVLAPPWVSVPPPKSGGIETVVHLLATGYQAAGHEVQLFTTGDSNCPVPRLHHYDEAQGEAAGSPGTHLLHVPAGDAALADCARSHPPTPAGPRLP